MPYLSEPLVDTIHFTRAAGLTSCSSRMADGATEYSKEKIQEISERSARTLRAKVRVHEKEFPGQMSIELFQKMAKEQGKEFAKAIYGELVEVFTESEKWTKYRLYIKLAKENAAEWAKNLMKFMVAELGIELKLTVALLGNGNGFKYEHAKTAANEFTSAMTSWVEMRVFRRREITGISRKRENQSVQPQEA